MDLIQIINFIFRNKFNRQDRNGQFTSKLYRVIGVKDANNYNDVIKTLQKKCDENKDISIIFDGNISLNGEMELIEYIYNELNSMDVNNISKEDIVIFDDANINNLFLKSLEYTVLLAIKNENFFNNAVRNNFITKLIVWTYTWVKNIVVDSNINPKCIYYGNIEKHEVYFLIMLYKMGFDVLYINPLKEELWDKIDIDKLSECHREMGILSIESFEERARLGKNIENIETLTKHIQREVHNELFSNTGMYKPWQFRDGYVKSVLLDTIIEDMYVYWNEQAKLREGFKVNGNIVTVPCFFYKVDGLYYDIEENQRILKHYTNSKNTLFFNGGNISKEAKVSNDMYELMFSQLSDGSFDIEGVKKCKVYKFSKYSEEVQNYLLNKFNETILDKNLFVRSFDKELSLKLLALVLSLNEEIIRLVDNFDFTAYIPKIVIYLNNEDNISEAMLMLLGYIHTMGFDIVIFNPSGLLNINNVIKKEKTNISRLDEVKYNSVYNNIMNHKQSIFSKLLNK